PVVPPPDEIESEDCTKVSARVALGGKLSRPDAAGCPAGALQGDTLRDRSAVTRSPLALPLLATMGYRSGSIWPARPFARNTLPHARTGDRRMTPKPLSDAVNRGLGYLIGQQHATGGWGQGGGWRSNLQGGRVEGADVADPPDVANTCMAALALL